MECVTGLYKTECIRSTVFHDGPYRSIHDVEYGSPCRDRHQVLDTLKARPYRVTLVVDCDVAAHARDARIVERGRQPLERGRWQIALQH